MRLPPPSIVPPPPPPSSDHSEEHPPAPPTPPSESEEDGDSDEVAPLRPQGRRRPTTGGRGMPQRARSSRSNLYSPEVPDGRKKLNGLPPKAASTRGF
ncbi:unnamed protein product [Cylindrotheca closterium]|uniref:Uncharacterized protein n=1 Tax=Cylindrotheca closterium TaxID=2856 RepID=A0AAD2CHA8_9STRA|nr:unnamed protein product [Cylindrotheca closterium]